MPEIFIRTTHFAAGEDETAKKCAKEHFFVLHWYMDVCRSLLNGTELRGLNFQFLAVRLKYKEPGTRSIALFLHLQTSGEPSRQIKTQLVYNI